MASELKVDKFTGVTTAGSISVTGEGNSTTTNLQQGLAKAWVNFNGTGTIATRDSFNLTTLTDNGTGDYSNPICSTHINGDIGSWSDYPTNYSYLATPTYTLGQTIIFRPAFAKDIIMGNSFTYYFSHNTNGIITSFIVQEISA